MELSVHESVLHTQEAVKRARKQANRAQKRARRRAMDTVDKARAMDLHEPAQVAKVTAKKAAKRAGKQAKATAGRVAKQKSRSAAGRVTRVGVTVLAAGALVAVTVVMIRRMRATSGPDVATADFEDANVSASHEPMTQNGSNNGAEPRTQRVSVPASGE